MKRMTAPLLMCAAAAAIVWADMAAAIANGTVWPSAAGAVLLVATGILVTEKALRRAAGFLFGAVLGILLLQLALPMDSGAAAARYIAVGGVRLYSSGFVLLLIPVLAHAVLAVGMSFPRRCLCGLAFLFTVISVFMQPNLKVVLEIALAGLLFFLLLLARDRQYVWLLLPALFSLLAAGFILLRTGQAHRLLFAASAKSEAFLWDGAFFRIAVPYALLLAVLFWWAYRQREPFAWGMGVLTASAFLACFAVSLTATVFSGTWQVTDLPLFSGEPTVKLSSYAVLGSVIALSLRNGARQRRDDAAAAPQ